MKKLLLAVVLLGGIHSAFASSTFNGDQAYINFGLINVITGGAQTQYVTLSNTDATPMGPLEIASTCFLPDFTVTADCPDTLPANSSCQIYVTFKPTHIGFFDCSISIASENAPGQSEVTVTGQGN
jgi:hypothetical protein